MLILPALLAAALVPGTAFAGLPALDADGAATSPTTAAPPPPDPGSWIVPSCRRIVGTGAVTYTQDDALTLATPTRRLTGVVYTLGLAALDTPNTLLAVSGRKLLRSTNAGCRWSSLGDIPSSSDGYPLYLAPASGGRAYAWADGRNDLARIDGAQVTVLASPVESIVGLAVDPADPDHVRIGDGNGVVWESHTAGEGRWSVVGTPPVSGPLLIVYRVAFDPADLDHVLVGTAGTAAFVSHDGGATWSPSSGLSSTGGPTNVFSLAISPADGGTVYAMGLDINESDAGIPPAFGRHIYASHDGGSSFAPVVDASPGITLINGPLLAPHPADSGVLYFVFGTGFQNYGTDLHRFDAGTGQVTTTHSAYDGFGAIAFSPANPAYLYLGLNSENF